MSIIAPRSQTAHAVVMMICAGAVIALLWAILRYASETMNPLYMVFWRSLFGAMLLAPMFMRTGVGSLRTKRLPLHFARSAFGVFAMIGIFYSVAHIELAQAVAISYSAPLFATLGAVLILGEKIRARRVFAIVVGFFGMVVVLRPGMESINLGTLAAVMGAAATAGSLLCIKKLSETDAVFFAEQPDVYAWVGAGVILCSTVYIARREAKDGDNSDISAPQPPGHI